jgi:hypothetical protein
MGGINGGIVSPTEDAAVSVAAVAAFVFMRALD